MNHITDEELIDYLHHGLDDDRADARVHEHLALCRLCSERHDAEAALGEMLRASALAEEREFPSIIKARVWAAVRAQEPTLLERIRAVVSPGLVVPLAAALALLMYFGVPVIRGNQATGTPSVAAAYYFEEHAAAGLENPLADHVATNTTLALGSSAGATGAPLIDAAQAATLDDVAASRE